MECVISIARPNQSEAISALVQASFLEFVAPDWDPNARETFLKESSPQDLEAGIANGEFAAAAQLDDQLVGFVLLPSPEILGMLFVHPNHVGHGIGGALWQAAKQHLNIRHPALEAIELNSSPYAVPAYSALGFRAISEPFWKSGCLATRMAYQLQTAPRNGGAHVA